MSEEKLIPPPPPPPPPTDGEPVEDPRKVYRSAITFEFQILAKDDDEAGKKYKEELLDRFSDLLIALPVMRVQANESGVLFLITEGLHEGPRDKDGKVIKQ